jgi:hypothetical protein
MNRNLVGSIYGRFSIRIAHFVPIIKKHGCHRQLSFLEQSQQRTFHRCFLPSFGSFGQTVSEEKNLILFKMQVVCIDQTKKNLKQQVFIT